MSPEISSIHLGGVNCYLIEAVGGFVLIDTGFASKRAKLEDELGAAGVHPGNLILILLTHGDSDHAGNCAYLREKYGAKIAMHVGDSGMVEHGDMSWNRKPCPDKLSILFKVMMKIGGLGKSSHFDTFKPDLYLEDGQDLSGFGLNSTVLNLPGHSKGSIGILTASGDLFCGDLIYNYPGFRFVDDIGEHQNSMDRLKGLKIQTVYPGHGKPFAMRS
jgi:hydroxyacylglutathione hydrolase